MLCTVVNHVVNTLHCAGACCAGLITHREDVQCTFARFPPRSADLHATWLAWVSKSSCWHICPISLCCARQGLVCPSVALQRRLKSLSSAIQQLHNRFINHFRFATS